MNKSLQIITFAKSFMRFSLIQLAIVGLIVTQLNAYSVTAQELLQQSVTIKVKNADLKSVLSQLEKQAHVKFVYSSRSLHMKRKVSVNAENKPLSAVLDAVFSPDQVSYKVMGGKVVLNMHYEVQGEPEVLEIHRTGPPPEPLQSFDRTISGSVTDDKGGELPGVSISVKGTTRGTLTSDKGTFSLSVPPGEVVLVFSFVGYLTQEIPLQNRTNLDVILEVDTKTLGEVVVVGFGTQKKTDMVGSVVSITPSDLKVPSSNLTTALAGRAAGVIAYQTSGEPGRDNANFFVRGITTFGESRRNPLILIDGMELTTTDLARLQPEDIQSFSIMKDATSTAVYGARGANGVILVTTKQGSVGRAKLSFRVENSVSSPTQNVEFADPVTYMKMHNEAVLTRTPIGKLGAETVLYGEEKIANTKIGANPVVYPANDWRAMLLKRSTMNQRYNLNISGGGGVAKYYVSGSLNQDHGIFKVDGRNNFNNNIDLKSYTLRSNITLDVTKSTNMIIRMSGNFDDYTGPIDGGEDMYYKIMRSNPVLFPAYYEPTDDFRYVKHIMFGNYAAGNYRNPYADMVKGYRDYSRSLMLAQLEVNQDLNFITPGLSVRGMVNTNRESQFEVSRFYNPFHYVMTGYDRFNDKLYLQNVNENSATEYLSYNEGEKIIYSTFYMESMLNYSRTLNDKHSFNGLLVYIMRNRLNANAGDLQLSLPFRNIGLSGRATYSYDNRYFLEFNFGYNGSERFHEKNRFGFFPSAGVAWTLSNEHFFERWKHSITNLRLRATYGLIGNDAIGSDTDRFFYLSNVDMNDAGRAAIFGRERMHSLPGISISRYSNPDISWEISSKSNIALELGLFEKVNIQAEVFKERRRNILMTRASVPVTMGLSAPIRANVGEASGKGVDLSLDYKHSLANGMWLGAMGNFTYATSKYEVYEEPQYAEPYRYRVGQSINQGYGLIAERLFVDDQEAVNSPRQNFGEYGGGDIKYLDVNRDGQVTNADIVPIGYPQIPEIVYGFGFSAGFRGFDFSTFFQGLTNRSFWIDVNATSPFQNQTQVLKSYADSYWSEESRDVYALWPRLSQYVNNNNAQRSTWFMRDGTFLRLKQLEIGYTVPESVQRKLKASNMRIYLNGTNLLTFSRFKMWDVEMGGDGLGYPIQKVFNVGMNLSFN